MANEVRLEGFKEFKDKLNQLPKKVNGNLSAFVSDAGKKWVQLAKNSAPIDNGKLAGGITEKTTGLVSEVTVNAKYAQFIEWGTKRRKVVPPGLTAYANSLQYQKTGDYYDFLNAILDWVKRKGVGATSVRKKNNTQLK